ncbi:MAG: hypothetical protein QOE94_1276 [Mycobacterium sp.]|jgi:hypothetical protein|nr:hypothetical protein [Mycobacterium sp.]MDT7720265.1 hypothetical protein [Mycobacterium sp.]
MSTFDTHRASTAPVGRKHQAALAVAATTAVVSTGSPSKSVGAPTVWGSTTAPLPTMAV